MRAFLAINLPEKIKDGISKIQLELKKTGADIKWVHKENIHITLKFLGEIDQDIKGNIENILKNTKVNFSTFKLKLENIGAFPGWKNPRVLWIGISEGVDKLMKLQQHVENRLKELGLKLDTKPFSAHITIGRLRSTRGMKDFFKKLMELTGIEEMVESLPIGSIGEINVTEVCLMQSTLTPAGPVYTVLNKVDLKHE